MMDFLIRSIPSIPGGKISVTQFIWCLPIYEVDVKKLEKPLTSDEIVDKISGGDKTAGSCASVAFAYIGNEAGYDVYDYRGGTSQKYFSDRANLEEIAIQSGGTVFRDKNAIRSTFDTLKLEITTDCTTTPFNTLEKAIVIAKNIFNSFDDNKKFTTVEKEAILDLDIENVKIQRMLNNSIKDMGFSKRSFNALNQANIKYVKDLVVLTEENLLAIKNLG